MLNFLWKALGCAASKPVEDDRNAAGAISSQGIRLEEEVEAAAGAIGGFRDISTKVQLSISCKNIADVDCGSLSDPFCVVYTRNSPSAPWTEVTRTEIIANTLNPEWVTLIQMSYHFEELQLLRLEVYDVKDTFSSSSAEGLLLDDQNFLGYLEFALAQVLSANNRTWQAPLVNASSLPNQAAVLQVKAEEVANQNALIELQLQLEEFTGEGIADEINLFLRLSRQIETGGAMPFFKSETRSSTKAVWSQIDTTLQQIANGDMYRPVVFELFNWQRSGDHSLIGSCEASVDDLIRLSSCNQHLKILGQNRLQCGSLVLNKCVCKPKATFFDYVFGQGFEINAVVAIDFTASNGHPSNMKSLHYLSPQGTMNQYAQAISGVGDVIQFYDTDKLYPVFGFGAKLGIGQPTSHLFAVNANEANPEVEGVDGILRCYHECLQRIELHGPTIFSPVISQAAAMAASTLTTDPCSQKYYILLIITDGIINDMANTIDAIVEASTLPLSIIIVGVGEADFSAMEVLDGDDEPLISSNGVKISRDIVQFVPIKQFLNRGPHALAKEVLEEVPNQLLSYMEVNNIPPPPPRSHIITT
mmetsp:Transcript_26750/g.35145  ORF Transcript_26750/g.35145 Transcript_26750/m.35145 type:complete len:588 (+) Transcript_26750:60-1823(+)